MKQHWKFGALTTFASMIAKKTLLGFFAGVTCCACAMHP